MMYIGVVAKLGLHIHVCVQGVQRNRMAHASELLHSLHTHIGCAATLHAMRTRTAVCMAEL